MITEESSLLRNITFMKRLRCEQQNIEAWWVKRFTSNKRWTSKHWLNVTVAEIQTIDFPDNSVVLRQLIIDRAAA